MDLYKGALYLYFAFAVFFLEWEMLRRKIVETIKTFCVQTLSQNHAVGELMCKNMAAPDMISV
jgi:hypothetical protein